MKNITLVLGASTNPNRYSNIAIKRLVDRNLAVVAIGLRKGKVLEVVIDDEKQDYKTIDTVTLYLNSKRQEAYYSYIIALNPRRVIFNPGTENMEFVKLLQENNIEAEIACTLVLLSTNQY
ncbi:MAG: putative CoA-binding protein [Paraglaciecola sp.]|jgi:predicted CoA-binding protein|uniref:CoA-binding protein n=1 Tax=Polaribacter sp. TaxID=1920175 RepID=UPI003ABFF2DB